MKLLIVTIITAIFASGQAFATDYRLTEAKADRFFDNREWASAQALYGLMLEQEPGRGRDILPCHRRIGNDG